MPEHKNITDPNIHEPKGISTALEDSVYISNGLGTGYWGTPLLQGQSVANINEIPFNNGSGGVSWKPSDSANIMSKLFIASSNIVVSLPTASDGSLHTTTDYRDITSNYTKAFELGIAINPSNRFIIPSNGIYKISSWISLSQDSASQPVVGFDLSINGISSGASSSVVKVKSKNAGDISTITGFGMSQFNTGDLIGVSLASTLATNVTIYESVFEITKVRSI